MHTFQKKTQQHFELYNHNITKLLVENYVFPTTNYLSQKSLHLGEAIMMLWECLA